MFDDKELGSSLFKNPNMIQHRVLAEHQKRLGGERIVADPNNSFNFLLEATSNMTADSNIRMENALAPVYPLRAQTSEDLYRHMSDFDYIGLYSLPASIKLDLILDKAYLIKHAKKFNDNYNKVIIPKDTIFTIGKYQFGMYYPIEIQISRSTNSINLVYDTTEMNPLDSLLDNTLIKNEYKYKNLELLSIRFPIYQFSKSVIREDINPALGFTKKYEYNNKFYAIRAWTIKDGKHVELKYTLSDTVYDPFTPTIKVKILEEDEEVKLTIPQVYFTNGQIGHKLEIEMYTTHGKLDVDISEVDESSKGANFAFKSRTTTEFSSILNTIPTIILQPTENKIVGGSNGYTYEQLRSYIINDTLHESVPVTPIELTNYFSKRGIDIKKYRDNITDRIFYGYTTLTDLSGSLIPVTNTTTKITNKLIESVDTIVTNIDGSITILPSTIYEYDPYNDACIPLTTEVVDNLLSKNKADLVKELNDNTYTKSPFHMRMITRDRYPRVDSYNLNDPEVIDLTFVEDNTTMSAQLTIIAAKLLHRKEGTGGYELRLGIQKSTDVLDLPEEDIVVYVQGITSAGSYMGNAATKIGEDGDIHIYSILLDTDYHINDNNQISITTLKTSEGIEHTHYFNLETEFNVVTMINSGIFEGVQQNLNIMKNMPDMYNTYIGSSRQNMKLVFGHVLSDTILNNVDINWSDREYALHETDVYFIHSEDVYETNEDGSLVSEIVDGEVVLNKLYSEGDTILDEDDNPIVKHSIGSIKYDAEGNPILRKDRIIEYFIDTMQFDMRIFQSEDPLMQRYIDTLSKSIESYLSVIRQSNNQLLERTELYFRPTNTLGLGKFGLGDSRSVTLPLDLSFKIKIYVPPYVFADSQILDLIRESTISTIENHLSEKIISMTHVSKRIEEDLDEYIDTIDIGGINNDINLQTLLVQDENVRPSIRQQLIYENNTITLEKAIDIEFISTK